MATEIGVGAQNAATNAVAALYNEGTLEIRTGPPPGPNAAASGTLLCAITLPAQAFAPATNGTAQMAGTWEGVGIAAGEAGHYRLIPDGDPGTANPASLRLEGTVSDRNGDGDLKLVNTNIAVDQPVAVEDYSITTPAKAPVVEEE